MVKDGLCVQLTGDTAARLGEELLVRGGHIYQDGDTYRIGGASEIRPADTGLRVSAFTLPASDVAAIEHFTWADLPA